MDETLLVLLIFIKTAAECTHPKGAGLIFADCGNGTVIKGVGVCGFFLEMEKLIFLPYVLIDSFIKRAYPQNAASAFVNYLSLYWLQS